MKSMTQLKSLADMRTVISTHIRSTPRHKGTAYLEVLSLGMERMRLEAELEMLSKRRKRIEGRLEEIRVSMGDLVKEVQQKQQGPSASHPGATNAENVAREKSGSPDLRRWRNMTVDY